MRVSDVFGSGQHRTNHGGDFDNGSEALLDGPSAYHAVLRAVLAHVGKVVKQKCITDRAWREGNDVFALFFLEAENQISTLSHRSGESAGSESAWFNVDAGHKSGTGRIHLASRKATRAGARNLHSGAIEVASEQESPIGDRQILPVQTNMICIPHTPLYLYLAYGNYNPQSYLSYRYYNLGLNRFTP